MVEVAPRTGLVFLHHCGNAFPRYLPCGWVCYGGWLCWGLERLRGGASILRRVTWCVRQTIGDSVGWWSVRNSQGMLSRFFAGKETAESEEITIDQSGVSREVVTLHSWELVMVKTCDKKERDNAVNCYPLHPLGYASDHKYIVDARLYELHLEASEV